MPQFPLYTDIQEQCNGTYDANFGHHVLQVMWLVGAKHEHSIENKGQILDNAEYKQFLPVQKSSNTIHCLLTII